MRRLLLALLLTGLLTGSARADDGVMNNGAFGPEPVGWRPGAESIVRMLDEKLRIDFHYEYTEVRAVFTFRNMGDSPVRQLLGFPDQAAGEEEAEKIGRYEGGDGRVGPIENMVTLVNGKQISSERQLGWVSYKEHGTWVPVTDPRADSYPVVWWTVWVDFPVGREVTVERRYRVGNGMNVVSGPFFNYITATGAAWRGTIGLLTAEVNLHDGFIADDFAGAMYDDETSQPDGWQRVSATRLRLQWRDFEPGAQMNRRDFTVRLGSFPYPSYGIKPEQLLFAARCGLTRELGSALDDTTVNRNCRDARGRTPYYLALANNHEACAHLLLDAGADATIPDSQGKTPLMVAAQLGQIDAVKTMLERGVNTAAKDRRGRTALDYAEYNGQDEVAVWLRQALDSRGSGR